MQTQMKLGHNIIYTTSQETMSPNIGWSGTLVYWDQLEEQRGIKKAPKKGGEKEQNERKRWDFQRVLTDLHFIIER